MNNLVIRSLDPISRDFDKDKLDVAIPKIAPSGVDPIQELSRRQATHRRRYGNSTRIISIFTPHFSIKNLLEYVPTPFTALDLDINDLFDLWIREGDNTATAFQELENRLCDSIKNIRINFHYSTRFRNGNFYLSTGVDKVDKLSSIPLQERMSKFEDFVDIVCQNHIAADDLLFNVTLHV